MARVIDINAARAERAAARAEAGEEGVELIVGEHKFTLPPELPWTTAVRFAIGDVNGGLRALLGDEAAATILATGIDGAEDKGATKDDLQAIVDGINAAYGVTTPESKASSGSSTNDGDSSRPTSNGSTDSTSEPS